MHTRLAEIVDAVEADRAELTANCRALTQAQLDFRPHEEAWSIGENLDHLHLVEQSVAKLFALKLKQAQAENTPRIEAAIGEQESLLGSLDAFKIETVVQKRKNPPYTAPRAGLSKAELDAELEGSRIALRNTIEALADYDLAHLTHEHPALGEIDLYRWILFVGKHERRHLAQIKNVKADPHFPAAT